MSERVAVLGAGTMGHGIAQVAATSGFEVCLYDINEAILAAARSKVEQALATGVSKGKLAAADRDAALGRLHTSTKLAEAVRDTVLVIEAVPEKLDLKQQVFREVSAHAPPGAVLATNTSSLSIDSIASALREPARLVGMHFFNPPYVLTLLELVRGKRTAAPVIERAKELAKRLGRELVVVNDSPGFATSRLGVVVGLEAIRMVEQGVASAEDIDRAMELGYRYPMGPLRLGDLVGLDVRLAIADHLYKELGGEQYKPPELLRRMVAEGKLGKKSGQGFYRW